MRRNRRARMKKRASGLIHRLTKMKKRSSKDPRSRAYSRQPSSTLSSMKTRTPRSRGAKSSSRRRRLPDPTT
jgi:hypothetical protein